MVQLSLIAKTKGEFMNTIKLVAFDIDGTLIPRGSQVIPENTKQAIQELQRQGTQICVATGRSSFFIQDDVINTIHPDFYVTVNGQLVTDKHFNPLVEKRLDLKESLMILQYCKENNIAVGCKMLNSIDVYHDYETFWPIYLHGIEEQKNILVNREHQPLLQSEGAPFGIFMIGKDELILPLQNKLTSLTLSHAYDGAYELFDNSVGKGDGLQYVVDHFGFSWDEVIAFGDAHNDIFMLEKAGISVAMGNASQDCKDAADFITLDSSDNGIAHALRHYKLIQ